jgi:hypothetical protein
MLAICVPWFPASPITEPFITICMPPFGGVPLAANAPIGPLLIWVTWLNHQTTPVGFFLAEEAD